MAFINRTTEITYPLTPLPLSPRLPSTWLRTGRPGTGAGGKGEGSVYFHSIIVGVITPIDDVAQHNRTLIVKFNSAFV
jgi:hypothetical protein